MENKETLSRTMYDNTLLNNEEYFKYIFKKTEKIVCAVFYIMRQEQSQGHNDDLIRDLKKSAQTLLKTSLKSLRATSKDIYEKINELRFNILELESQLRAVHSGGIISIETLQVFLNETDSVLRSLKKYIRHGQSDPFGEDSSIQRTNKSSTGPTRRITSNSNMENITQTEVTVPRRDRILSVLKERGEASIKDIVEVVTDCSEKTIQRDLTGLIKDNLVLREGERRWSKYKPA